MCGILGVFQPTGDFDPQDSEHRLIEAGSALQHRGPDASAVVLDSEAGIAFGHRRLAILDLDPRSNQPMPSTDRRLLITFNGEIYNFEELKKELRDEGVTFRTKSDTEVLLEGYARWGIEKLLPKLCGMFAFALYDKNRKCLILARDRAGKKPLYYHDNGGFVFCSELRGLLKLLPHKPSLDPVGLDAYLSLKFMPSPQTLLTGVRKLSPGHYLEKIAGHPARIQRYWHPFTGHLPPPASIAESLDRIETAFNSAVRRRLVSDVPVCLFLSGGVDSSLIAATLAHVGVKDMAAYSIGYRDLPGYSEFEFSRSIAKRFPLQYHEIVLDSRQALQTLEDDAAMLDEPISDWVWIPLYHLSQKAHNGGFKVALVGEGSDEIFFGYDSMMKGLHAIRRFSQPLWKTAAKLGAPLLAPIYRMSNRGHRRYDRLRRAAAGEPVYMGSSLGFDRSQHPQIAGPQLLKTGRADAGIGFIASLQNSYREFSDHPEDDANLICYTEFYSKMSEVLLQRVDRVSMLHSLEARCPFLDHELVELAFAVPGQWKIPNGMLKGLLKEFARKRLPEEILARPKMGFSFPFKEWLRGELGPMVQKTFEASRLIQEGWINGKFCQRLLSEHRSGWVDHGPQIWMLFDLCRWYDRWIA